MELPRRNRGDELLKPGELTELRQRLRNLATRQDLATVIACAFDHRTRMLPFIYADKRMAPAGVRAIGAAMLDSGFEKTRIVLQQWNKNFQPARMRIDGRVPDLFMISSMQIHTTACKNLLRDIHRIEPENRPLVVVGGPKTIYEPWDVFSNDPQMPYGADLAVTGEEFVLLSLLELLLDQRGNGESLRSTFLRARHAGLLNNVPGLVYALGDRDGLAEELVDTGIQRLLGDLDEQSHPVLGYRILEPPGRKPTLASQPVPPERVRKYTPVGSLIMTFGCKFGCHYCPIPAYNQRQYRTKSGERIADEFYQLNRQYGIHYFFGTDDNFFNDKKRSLDILEKLASTEIEGQRIRKKVRWATEVTVHDTLKMKEYLPLVRNSGVRALWLGVEDMTASLIKKGQSVDKTTEAFRAMQQNGICPMPMMMHHDTQPLISRNGNYGLLNQARLLRKAGAIGLQVLMITPATGSKSYEETFTSGLTYESAGGKKVEPHMLDANFVIASEHPQPWKKQLNIMAAYLWFFNPLRFMKTLVRPRSRLYLADALMQAVGMYGLIQTFRRTIGWTFRLMRGPIKRRTQPPISPIPMRNTDHKPADHALPGTICPDACPHQAPQTVEQNTAS